MLLGTPLDCCSPCSTIIAQEKLLSAPPARRQRRARRPEAAMTRGTTLCCLRQTGERAGKGAAPRCEGRAAGSAGRTASPLPHGCHG